VRIRFASLGFVLLTAVFLLLVVQSGQPNQSLRDSVLAGAHHGQPGEILRNAGLDAARICVFGAGTPADMIDEVLGFSWPIAVATGIGATSVEDLVVAANARDVRAWAMVPRGSADFLRPDGYGCQAVAPLDY
jgi:hypothetical protein